MIRPTSDKKCEWLEKWNYWQIYNGAKIKMEESVRPTHYPGQPPGGQGQLPGVSLPGLQPITPLPGVPAPNGCGTICQD